MSERLILKKEVFEKEVLIHKCALNKLDRILRIHGDVLTNKQVNDLFTPAVKTGKELSLASARLKCEKTGASDNLQFHHLVGRDNRKIMIFPKYATQRHYYKNIVILSQKHHNGNNSEDLVISDEFIEMVRRKYFK